MKIKKLELIGFKSFVDRTVVNFDHDVLGIVGPNGCGKSNIVDAIRWCMGEQSAKHLRGRSMDDVIFSGSESRAGHDFAEVTLTFENNDPSDVPLEYREYAEIAITRRLDRSGDSDYLINRTQVRLKDVTDLFLGTGVGTKAYSIIEQGKVGLIVSAKAEDRRILIEEAAGITKFKSKKKQAEKKMELTQLNLLRVGDIVSEIERNLGSLKRQAAKAERYLAYRGELEDLQLHEASHRYLELTGWLKLEASEVERCTLDADGARAALVAREAELEGLRLEALGAEEVLDTATAEHFAKENEVRTEEGAIARAKDRSQSLRDREVQAATEATEIGHNELQLEGERTSTQLEVETLEREEATFDEQLFAEEDKLNELVDQQSSAEAHLSELRKVASGAQADVAGAEAKLSGFDRRQNELLVRRDRMRVEREDLEGDQLEQAARVNELSTNIEELRSGKVMSAEEREILEERLTQLKQTILEQEHALDDAKTEFSRKRSRLQALQEMQARFEGVGAGTKSLLATRNECLVGLVADLVEAPADYTPALAGLLGSRLQDVVVNDLDRGAELLATLAATRKGRATIIPRHPRYISGASSVSVPDDDEGLVCRLADVLRFAPGDEALVQALVGDALVVRDLASAHRLQARVGNCALVTLDGTVLHVDGRISGGQGEEVAAGMLDSKREARELSEEVVRLEKRASECLAAHQASRVAIAETSTGLERARQQAHADEIALVTAEKDLQRAEQQLDTVRKRLESIVAEQEDLGFAMQEAERERDDATCLLEQARARIDDAELKLEEAEAVAAAWREQVAARRQVVTERKVRVAGIRERLAAARGTVSRVTRSIEELAIRRTRLEDELVTNARTLGEIAAQLLQMQEQLHAAIDASRAAGERLAAARATFDCFRVELNEREGALKGLRSRDEEARDELVLHEMQLRERAIAMQHLLEGVAEKFRGLVLPRVVGDYHLRPPPDEELKSRIGEIVTLLERMGSVNLDAVREHEEAETRYTFYSEQKADLEKALDDLERAIAQMNKESKRLFKETFDAVNAKFEEIFPRMFHGGRASLRLTNPDDILETGIDILAQPPGKKLSSIELMSGGEKALTAVSLIFAIFQVKPSPFCILDEVDAPLDEANVARYNDMIRTMTHSSQFILITHIKRTMQMVDALYGVTMAESGVSKLVSVRLTEKQEKRLPEAINAAVA